LHFGGFGFAIFAATLAAGGGFGGVPRGSVQPTDHGAVGDEIGSFTMEQDEDGLGDVLGLVWIVQATAS
jgi:hypothetical protein